MKVIVLRDKDGAAWSTWFRRAAGLTFSMALALVAGVGGYVLHAVTAASPTMNQLAAEWHDQMGQQNEAIAELRARADYQSSAVGQRLAQMQARMLRMEALGERVTEIAKIDSSEFNFGMPVAQGGPQMHGDEQPVGSGFTDFNRALDQMSEVLQAQERQLLVLQDVLVDEQLKDAAAVKGRPVRWGWMSSPYGKRVDPFTGKMAWHAGMDFAGREDSEVVAVASGVVVFAGRRSGYGNLVEINHGDGYVTRYAHHKQVLVDTGQVVKKGQAIALMGSTGRSTGPHVHFEVLRNGRTQNPAKFVQSNG